MKKSHLIAVLSLCFLAAGCAENELREEFIAPENNGLGLQEKGTQIFEYDASTCQYSYLPDSREFRIGDDAMNNYFILKLSSIPSLNEEATGTLVYTTESSILTKAGLSFKLVKVEETKEGRMLWLWNKKSQYGAVVMEIL